MTRIDLDRPWPRIAATGEELARLRKAWQGEGPDQQVVARLVQKATERLEEPVAFPPRGGQHNQWYQCDACQHALETIDDTHHRCPLCEKVYSGPPYDDVIFRIRHEENLARAENAAWAWAITGKETFAADARKILLAYAERYRDYTFHDNGLREGDEASKSGGRLFEQTLNEASSMTRTIAPACDLLYASPLVSDADRRKINDGLIRPMLEGMARHRAGKSNWQTWHNAAFVWGGAVLGDAEWVRRGIDDPENGFRYQMTASITPEGMWYENSWGYHFYALMALVETAEGARRLGIDLWREPQMRAAFTLPARYLMPDGTLPRFADAVDTRLDAPGTRAMFELASRAYPDAGLEALLPAAPTWETVLTGRGLHKRDMPSLDSAVIPGTGHAILRSDGPAGLAAVMTFGPHGGFHGHFDKLSFVFFGLGRELGVDPGRATSQAYRLPIHRNWYRATISHNTVLVDGQSQEGAAGELEFFSDKPGCTAAAARCSGAYKGVTHRRLLALTPTYLLVVDDLQADKPRRFTWLYHNRGTGVDTPLAAPPVEGLPGLQGGEYFRDIRRAAAEDAIAVRFDDGDVKTHLLLGGEPDTELHLATGPAGSVEDRVPLIAVTRNGRSVRYAAVLEPTRDSAAPSARKVTLREAQQGIEVAVETRNGTNTFIWSADGLHLPARPEAKGKDPQP